MRSIVDAGELLPDSLMLEVLKQRLVSGQAAGESGVLLDGFPRTRAQVGSAVSDRCSLPLTCVMSRQRMSPANSSLTP